jgi:LAO/AO transport system kinase
MLAAAPQVGRSARGGAAADDTGGRPKRPDVVVTTASTGQGVPELLSAIDARRPRTGVNDRAGSTPRIARAEAQVWAVVVERLRSRLREPGRWPRTEATIREVAAHELDPYGAADRLLASLVAEPDGGGAPES